MKTIFYVGKSYPHRGPLLQLKAAGYRLGILHDQLAPLPHPDIFDSVIELDFSTEAAFVDMLRHVELPPIDGLSCLYENYIIYKALAAEILSLPSLSVESARACTDKYLMRGRFMAHNPAITPQFIHVRSRDQLLEFADRVGYPLILKPTNLVKSLLVSKCSNSQELLNAYDTTLSQIDGLYAKLRITNRVPGLVLEQFIAGQMCSIAAFVDAGGTPHFCDGIVELVTAQDVGYDDNFLFARKIVNDYSPELAAKLFQTATDGIAALDMRASPAHVELIYNDHEVKIVEIGARTGGYRPFLYRESYHIDMIIQEAHIAVGDQPELGGKFKNYSAMYELFPRTTSTYVALDGVKADDDYRYIHQVAQPGDTVGRAKDGYRALAIIGVADPDRESFQAQCQAIEQIKVITK